MRLPTFFFACDTQGFFNTRVCGLVMGMVCIMHFLATEHSGIVCSCGAITGMETRLYGCKVAYVYFSGMDGVFALIDLHCHVYVIHGRNCLVLIAYILCKYFDDGLVRFTQRKDRKEYEREKYTLLTLSALYTYPVTSQLDGERRVLHLALTEI